jgi:hypothetical protein
MQMHGTSKILEHRLVFDVKVAEHGIGLPTSEQLDHIFVNLGTDKGHHT